MNWTPILVDRCRNRRFVRFGRMHRHAAEMMVDLYLREPQHVEYYGEAGWHPAAGRFHVPFPADIAFRLTPNYRPLSALAGR